MFAEPLWLYGLLALPVTALGMLLALRRDRERVARLVARPLWTRVVDAPAEHWRWLRLGLVLVGVAGVVLALARPQWGVVREAIEREGVDVVLVLDTSGSMATPDVPPDRFFLARQALLSLVQQLDQDRFALVAFEGEAYPLVPLTLDADAVGLFLETLEPGFVPGPGSALGQGLERGLELFVDQGRRNKVMVLVSDGEDLEGEVDRAVSRAAEAGVVIHTVGVGTEQGQPVPDFDQNGEQVGFKKQRDGTVVVSRLDAATLEAIARGTSGRYLHITPADASLRTIAAAIDEMEERTLARDFDYRKIDRFQVPLGIGLLALTLAALLPLPRRREAAALRPREPATAPLALAALLLLPGGARAQEGGSVLDEVLLRPTRLTEQGIAQLESGDHPAALKSFEEAAALREDDALSRFNLAGGLYRNGRFPDAAAVYEALASAPEPALAAAARYNLGNTLFESQQYEPAIAAYRSALQLDPEDEATRRNLELALRRLQEQQQQQQQQNQDPDQQQDQNQQQQQQNGDQDQQSQQQQGEQDQQQQQQQGEPPPPQGGQGQPPPTPQQRADRRFEQEAGMPRELAMQLLDALQENEKEEQKKTLAARQKKKGDKDW